MTPCLFSISYGGLWGQAALDLPAFIAKAAALGLRGRHARRQAAAPVAARLSAGTRRRVEGRPRRPRRRVPGRRRVHRLRRDAGRRGARHRDADRLRRIAVPHRPRARGEHRPRVHRVRDRIRSRSARLWNRVVAALREVCDRAAAYGFTVAIQNHHDVGVHTDALLELLDRHRPAELQARVRRVVAGPPRRGPVRVGPAGGPAHGHHDERRLHPAAAVPATGRQW